jgi:hypothetical protein
MNLGVEIESPSVITPSPSGAVVSSVKAPPKKNLPYSLPSRKTVLVRERHRLLGKPFRLPRQAGDAVPYCCPRQCTGHRVSMPGSSRQRLCLMASRASLVNVAQVSQGRTEIREHEGILICGSQSYGCRTLLRAHSETLLKQGETSSRFSNTHAAKSVGDVT